MDALLACQGVHGAARSAILIAIDDLGSSWPWDASKPRMRVYSAKNVRMRGVVFSAGLSSVFPFFLSLSSSSVWPQAGAALRRGRVGGGRQMVRALY